MKLEGRITLSRVHCSTTPDYVHVEITDNGSRVRIVEACMSLEDAARFLTGQGEVPCTLTTGNLGRVGQLRESTTVATTDETAIAKLTAEGWQRSGDRNYGRSVLMERWIEREPKEA